MESIQKRVLYLPKEEVCDLSDLSLFTIFFLPIDPQIDILRQTSVQLNKKEHLGINLAGVILSLIVLLPVITSWTLIILYSPQNPFIWATVSNHTVAIKVLTYIYQTSIWSMHSKDLENISVKSDTRKPK